MSLVSERTVNNDREKQAKQGPRFVPSAQGRRSVAKTGGVQMRHHNVTSKNDVTRTEQIRLGM